MGGKKIFTKDMGERIARGFWESPMGREQRDRLARTVSVASRGNNRKNLVSYKEKPVVAAAGVCMSCELEHPGSLG